MREEKTYLEGVDGDEYIADPCSGGNWTHTRNTHKFLPAEQAISGASSQKSKQSGSTYVEPCAERGKFRIDVVIGAKLDDDRCSALYQDAGNRHVDVGLLAGYPDVEVGETTLAACSDSENTAVVHQGLVQAAYEVDG